MEAADLEKMFFSILKIWELRFGGELFLDVREHFICILLTENTLVINNVGHIGWITVSQDSTIKATSLF